MVLVYNLRDPADIYQRFGGVDGSAYVVGGVGLTFQKSGDVVTAPIRTGVGLRLGANVGYLKYTRAADLEPVLGTAVSPKRDIAGVTADACGPSILCANRHKRGRLAGSACRAAAFARRLWPHRLSLKPRMRH